MEFNLKAEDRKTTETTEAFGNIKFEGGQQQMALLDLNGYFNITGAESGKDQIYIRIVGEIGDFESLGPSGPAFCPPAILEIKGLHPLSKHRIEYNMEAFCYDKSKKLYDFGVFLWNRMSFMKIGKLTDTSELVPTLHNINICTDYFKESKVSIDKILGFNQGASSSKPMTLRAVKESLGTYEVPKGIYPL